MRCPPTTHTGHQRQAIDENNNIRAFFRAFNHCPLIADMKRIALNMLKIKELYKRCLLSALIKKVGSSCVFSRPLKNRFTLLKEQGLLPGVRLPEVK
jgi:hypothetical protein